MRSAALALDIVNTVYHSILTQARLHFNPPGSLVLHDCDGLIALLTEWCENDDPQKNNPSHEVDFAR
jgi:hypothetical protein